MGEYRKRLVDPVSDAGSLMDDDLIVLAMRDDVYVLAEPEIAILANRKIVIDRYRKAATGVIENREKTGAYVPECAHGSMKDWEDALVTIRKSYITEDHISTEGMKMVGAPVGNEAYCRAFLERESAKYPHFLPRLTTMDAQIANSLLRDCHLPIYTHLIRMVHPDHTHAR